VNLLIDLRPVFLASSDSFISSPSLRKALN
jgi:hypothetical protein